MQKDITLQFTPDEVNTIMEGLGNLPFVKVYQLIGKIQEQAGAQLQENSNGSPQSVQQSRLHIKEKV